MKKFLDESISTNRLPPKNGPITLSDPNDKDELRLLQNSIAVVGMSCRFPGANNPEEYWESLRDGRDSIINFPSDRPKLSVAENVHEFEGGFLTCPVDEFDAKFFGISPREAPFVDPQQRILLEVIWESLENAGVNPQSLKDSDTGVFLGIWQQDYDRYLPNKGLTANEYHHRYLGNAMSATSSRISYFLGNLSLQNKLSYRN